MTEPRGASLARLVAIMRRLLGPDGCPWDREQTFASLSGYVLEEAHEVVEAIDDGRPEPLREELGDLLLQVVFLSELAAREGWFGPDEVIGDVSDKLVRRHPHVFGDAAGGAITSGEVTEAWEAIKRREKAGRGLLDGVPVALPALLRASRVSEKAARVGLDWPDAAGVRRKIDEELGELDAAASPDEEEAELGDLLFAIASWSRKRGHDPERALRRALDRFTARVRRLEAGAAADGVRLEELDADAVDDRWRAAKAAERGSPDQR